MSLKVADFGWEPKCSFFFFFFFECLCCSCSLCWHVALRHPWISALLSTPNADDIWVTGRPSGIKEWILSLEDLDPGMPNPSEICEQADTANWLHKDSFFLGAWRSCWTPQQCCGKLPPVDTKEESCLPWWSAFLVSVRCNLSSSIPSFKIGFY